jgi:hypothetical protein
MHKKKIIASLDLKKMKAWFMGVLVFLFCEK